jgi:carbohydrate-selective porin OprB
MNVFSNRLGLSLLALLIAAGVAPAQQAIDPATLPPTQAIDAAPAERIFGNWGGVQDKLLSQGIGLRVYALTEFAGNVGGGTRQGSTFAEPAKGGEQ